MMYQQPGLMPMRGNYQEDPRLAQRNYQEDPRMMRQNYQEEPRPFARSMSEMPSNMMENFSTFNSPPTKLIAWAILQTLLRLFRDDTVLPAPTESAIVQKNARVERFSLNILGMAKHVQDYARGDNESITPFIAEKLIRPFLEYFSEEFPRYCHKIQLGPIIGEINVDPVLTQNIHQLHALFSAIYLSFLPPSFSYQGIPFHYAILFAVGFIKLMLAQLFRLTADNRIEDQSIFESVAKNYNILAQLKLDAFMQDRMHDGNFLEISVISNRIIGSLRKVAIGCYNEIARIYPALHTNQRFQMGLEALHYSTKAF